MTDNFISNVLNILRLIRSSDLAGHAPLTYINKWTGIELSEPAALRVCAYVQDQCDGALSLIQQSRLASEAQVGLMQTVQALRTSFSIQSLGQAVTNHLPQLDASISSFAILESVSNLTSARKEVPELGELIGEIEEMAKAFADADIDPLVRSTATKHLHVLLTLLRNVEALGVDAAFAAYAELVVRLRRVDGTASETARAKVAKLWPTIEKWAGRLALIDKAYNSGQGLLEHGHGLGQLLLSYAG